MKAPALESQSDHPPQNLPLTNIMPHNIFSTPFWPPPKKIHLHRPQIVGNTPVPSFLIDVDMIWQQHPTATPASKLQRQHRHTYLAPASCNHTQHPSSKEHTHAIDIWQQHPAAAPMCRFQSARRHTHLAAAALQQHQFFLLPRHAQHHHRPPKGRGIPIVKRLAGRVPVWRPALYHCEKNGKHL